MERANILLTVVSALALTPAAALADAPAAGSVGFSAVAYSGDGCPAGSVAISTSPDNLAFTLIFDSFQVAGTTTNGAEQSTACVADVNLTVPTGWSFSVLSVDTRGYAALATHQVKVDVNSTISIGNNNGNAASGSLRLRGPYDDDFQLRAVVNGNSGRWSSCSSRTFRVRLKSEIKMKREALAAIDSLDGQVQAMSLAWRRCP